MPKKKSAPKGDGRHKNVQIGRRIRLARLAKKWTQVDLAKAMGVTFQQIQKYENGMNGLSVERLRQVSGALDVDPLALAGYNDGGEMLPKINKQNIDLLEAWGQLDPRVRGSLLGLIQMINGGV